MATDRSAQTLPILRSSSPLVFGELTLDDIARRTPIFSREQSLGSAQHGIFGDVPDLWTAVCSAFVIASGLYTFQGKCRRSNARMLEQRSDPRIAV